MEEPSDAGLAIKGNASKDAEARPDILSTQMNGGVGTPWLAAMRFAMGLSSESAKVSGSLWVYGMPSISHTAGTCASRLRDPNPSAMLNTRSSARGNFEDAIEKPAPAAEFHGLMAGCAQSAGDAVDGLLEIVLLQQIVDTRR